MDWAATIIRWLDLAATVLSLLAIPFLAIALIRRVRARNLMGPLSGGALLSLGWVALLVAASLLAALVLGVPLRAGLATTVVVVLLAVLLVRDERFWRAVALLLTLYTAIGLVLLYGLSHNYGATDDTDAIWYGGRQLVYWGGLRANPSRGGWQGTLLALGVLRYGLPLALTLAAAWVAATRRNLDRIERSVLIFAGGALLTGVIFGAAVTMVQFTGGAVLGLPLVLAAVGIAGCVFTLLTIGPGSIGGALVGGRSLASQVPDELKSAVGFVSSLADTQDGATAEGGDEAADGGTVTGSLGRFLRGNVTRTQRLALKVTAVICALLVLTAVGGRLSSDYDMAAVSFEPIDRQVGTGFAVDGAFAGTGDHVLITGVDGEVARFDPAEGSVDQLDLRAVDAIADPGGAGVVVLTGEDPPRLVRVDAEVDELQTLPKGTAGKVALSDEQVYVAFADGRIQRFERPGGPAQAETKDDAARWITVLGGEVWTIADDPKGGAAEWVAVRRDPLTLAPLEELTVFDLDDGMTLLAGDTFKGAIFDPRTSQFSKVVRLDGTPHPDVAAGDGEWLLGLPRIGRIGHVEGDDVTHYDHHYDTVFGVFESEAGTWLVVANDRGTVVGVDEDSQGYVARWLDPPA